VIDFGLKALDDLQQNQDEGANIPILVPGSETPLMHIRVSGPDSKQQARAFERDAEELAARGSVTPLTRQEGAERGTRLLARCCMGWDAKTPNGEDIPFTEDAIFELLNRYKVIREQVDAAAYNRSRFIKRS
jgi:hypothetical protein